MGLPSDLSTSAVRVTEHRIGLLVIAGNLIGALVAFFYFQFIDASAPGIDPGLTGGRIAYFGIVFAVTVGLGLWLSRRGRRPLLAWAREGPRTGIPEALVRRRALALPYALAAVNLVGWTLAGVAWAVVWPWMLGTLAGWSMLRPLFGIILIGGTVTTAFVFFSVEHVWRGRLPLYFPRGDLRATPGVMRVDVLTRLIVIFVLVSVLPLSLLGVMCCRSPCWG